jgi:hypothetical protein
VNDLPEGVRDGVVDRIDRRVRKVWYGMGSQWDTPFWEWMAGQGLEHMWSVNRKLKHEPIDVLFFDCIFSGGNSILWEAPHLKGMVWDRARRMGPPPPRWEVETLCFSHHELGGVTDGTFHIRVALRERLEDTGPRLLIGTAACLNQVIDPTIRGRTYEGPDPEEGTLNTFRGILAWQKYHEPIVAPSVYPGHATWNVRWGTRNFSPL